MKCVTLKSSEVGEAGEAVEAGENGGSLERKKAYRQEAISINFN